ncbi:MAG: ribonuclease Y [Dehalococcoidia bacterium]
MDNLYIFISLVVGLLFGIIGFLFLVYVNNKRSEDARSEANLIIENALKKETEILVEAKEKALNTLSKAEKELNSKKFDIEKSERRLAEKNNELSNKIDSLSIKEKNLIKSEQQIRNKEFELKDITEQKVSELEKITNLSLEDAKNQLISEAEIQSKEEIEKRYLHQVEEVKLESNDIARKIIVDSIQRFASDVVSEKSVSSVALPDEDMKGRLIGREGRNIRAIETSTGVDVLIDDTPGMVVLSSFDPVRREIARLSVEKLIKDGRIQPSRIEEIVNRSNSEVQENIMKAGKNAVLELGISGLPNEIIKTLGELKYRYSYGENVLQHSIETGWLASLIASEVGADINKAKMGGFLHDIGKAMTHKIQGPHAEVGADLCKKQGIDKDVCDMIAEHHDDVHSSVEGFIVSAADAISAARPGARHNSLENYVKRLSEIENIANNFEGVEKSYAIQAGRELRVFVNPEVIDDTRAQNISREIVSELEKTLTYPGQIKVMVIRELRAIETAN